MSEELQSLLDGARRFNDERGSELVREFMDLLSLRNSAEHREDLTTNARFIQRALQSRGVDSDILEAPGAAPAVYGSLESPGSSTTLLVYAHYDGQPADPAEWASEPWEPQLHSHPFEGKTSLRSVPEGGRAPDPDWRIYARSAADNKAPIAAWLGAIDIARSLGRPPSVNVKFFFEGEEEIGSPNLGALLRTHRDRLDADALLICDGPVHQSRRPLLYFGARGYTGFRLRAYGPSRHLHSGHYGNWASNPAQALCRLIASFKDADGTVLVEGFEEDIAPLSSLEHEALESIPDVDEMLLDELWLAAPCDGSPLKHALLRPSLNVRGIKSGWVGESPLNMIPDVAEASVDIRLVKGQDPDRVLTCVAEHLRGQGAHVIDHEPDKETRTRHPIVVTMLRDSGYPATRTPLDLPVVRKVIDRVGAVRREDLVLMPSLGGSLPFATFERELKMPLIGIPLANHDNRQHGPDENLRVGNFFYGVEVFTALLLGGDLEIKP